MYAVLGKRGISPTINFQATISVVRYGNKEQKNNGVIVSYSVLIVKVCG